VEQFVMRDFSEEHSVLLQLAERLAERPVLVTFNGKTFDWPLLESRYLMTRSIRVPRLAAHLDLLHPARAVWKLRLGSVKLTELEEHVLDAKRLGWDRADDVPSAMIPQFYFDYLRGRSVAPLAGVVRHNRNDLRGLAALFGKLNQMLSCEQHGEDADGLDLFGLSRYLHRRGEVKRAEVACSKARERGLPIALEATAKWELARMAKRRGEHETAAQIWEELARDDDWRVAACDELANFYARRRQDFSMALRYARQAIVTLRKRAAGQKYGAQTALDLRKFERLGKKIARLESRLRKRTDAALLLPTDGKYRSYREPEITG
jgi:tetratricopeptide (TPR) repeat protein